MDSVINGISEHFSQAMKGLDHLKDGAVVNTLHYGAPIAGAVVDTGVALAKGTALTTAFCTVAGAVMGDVKSGLGAGLMWSAIGGLPLGLMMNVGPFVDGTSLGSKVSDRMLEARDNYAKQHDMKSAVLRPY